MIEHMAKRSMRYYTHPMPAILQVGGLALRYRMSHLELGDPLG